MSINTQMYKKFTLVYAYNKILFSPRKEGNPAICDNMD